MATKTHIIDKVCSCEHCTMLDIMWGDPLLSDWESKFIKDVARKGWIWDYTPKQKSKIRLIFLKQKVRYSKMMFYGGLQPME